VVLHHYDFDSNAVDYYTEENLRREWGVDSLNIQNGVVEGRTTIVADSNRERGRVLRVLYPKNTFGPAENGAQWLKKFSKRYEELYVSYWVKFPLGFQFVRGGKLPGLTGGLANTGGLKPNGVDGWSARVIWQPDGAIRQYVYHVDQSDPRYGDGRPWNINGQNCLFVPGVWHHLETYVRMNHPDRNDGRIVCWFDGQPAMDENNFRFRTDGGLSIDALYFSTFFGGGDSSWSSLRREGVLFDDIVVSRVPIHGFLFK